MESPAGAAPVPEQWAPAAASLFGPRLSLAKRYADLLVGEGVRRGLIGPREAPRIWDRHLINCAVVGELIDIGESVTDVGSGAGLPGLVLAIARPDLPVTVAEPLARRVEFLDEVVAVLDLGDQVTVVRGRAEELGPTRRSSGLPLADVVTSRAVGSLDRLARWCLPLTRRGGRMLAMKGSSAQAEIEAHGRAVAKLGGAEPVIRMCGIGVIDPPATVIEVVCKH
jgi:16S rRNA (guanine527-N7)-methyltransferase